MVGKKRACSLFLILFIVNCGLCVDSFSQDNVPQESDQQIMDFSLSSYGEKGKKAWDLSGKSANIFSDVVKLKDVVSNLYGVAENIKLTAEEGDFDKIEGKMHLEENVVITTSTGAKLTTDSLDWDRKNQIVSTEDTVNIERNEMLTTANGARGEPNLKKFNLQKDVTVNINPATEEKTKGTDGKKKIVITCDGPLEIDYDKNIATFNNKVRVDTLDAIILSDIMDVYFRNMGQDASGLKEANAGPGSAMGSKIDKIVARGNVQIIRGENISYSDEATYDSADKKISLSGSPKLVIYSEEDIGASFGN